MIQTKIVIKTQYRLSEGNKEKIKNFITIELDNRVIGDFYIEETTRFN